MAGEVLMVIIIILAMVAYAVWWFDKKNLKKLKKNYNPDEDKSKQGEERRSTRGREPISKVLLEPKGQVPSERADTIKDGEDGSSVREDGIPRNPFTRLQKQ